MMDNPKQREVHARATETISADVANRMKAWYILVRQMLPGPGAGIVVTLEDGQIGQIFVSANLTDNDKPALAKAVAAVAEQDGPVVDNGVFALPLRRGGEVYAALAIQLEAKDSQQRSVLKLLTWAERWQRLLLTAGATAPQALAPTTATPSVHVLETVLKTEPMAASLMALADQLAAQLDCERVAIGLRGKRGFKLEALSHGMQFDSRSRLAELLGEAMDQVEGAPLFWPDADSTQEGSLSELQNSASTARAMLILPLGENCAAVCERPLDQPFSEQEIADIASLGPLLGAALELRREQQNPISNRARAATGSLVQRLAGPGHRGAKALAAVSALLVLALALVPGTFRVHAEATIEGRVQRAVVAPFDGFIAEANRRAGDAVAAGEVIATLEDRELKLEMRKSASEEEKLD
ncbi:MAG: HlyD family efflux transporter periplasmic adaptor subunit, partial [Halieaceae bacterium]|nr:HlyD family efflux transporter periplasmic adaptor subunit [Halieaceae bacterium]